MISQSLPVRDTRILDARYFDGPNSLVDMLGFLGMDVYASPAGAGASREPGWPERHDDMHR
jgi:hypothetical protein